MLVGSHQGGVDIEKVAAEHPEAIFKEPVDINKGNFIVIRPSVICTNFVFYNFLILYCYFVRVKFGTSQKICKNNGFLGKLYTVCCRYNDEALSNIYRERCFID